MAYDAATSNVVLFGGYPDAIADTWVWNGSTWIRQSPANSPSGRWDAPMAFDAATGSVVLFGGQTGASHRFDDTWAWGSQQRDVHPHRNPPGRWAPSGR